MNGYGSQPPSQPQMLAALLLAALFASQFFGLKHVYGAGVLFFVATLLLGVALFRFAQEAWLARCEFEE